MLAEKREKRREKSGGREHPLVQTNFAREKGSRANLLSLLHLFLLSPKSLLHNTFRGPRYRYALFVGTSIARPK